MLKTLVSKIFSLYSKDCFSKKTPVISSLKVSIDCFLPFRTPLEREAINFVLRVGIAEGLSAGMKKVKIFCDLRYFVPYEKSHKFLCQNLDGCFITHSFTRPTQNTALLLRFLHWLEGEKATILNEIRTEKIGQRFKVKCLCTKQFEVSKTFEKNNCQPLATRYLLKRTPDIQFWGE